MIVLVMKEFIAVQPTTDLELSSTAEYAYDNRVCFVNKIYIFKLLYSYCIKGLSLI